MESSHQYRYIRSLGRRATLHAVTFQGIDDFLDSADADDCGLVMLLHGPEDEVQGGLHGGPEISAILREMKSLPDSMKETARPMAVVTFSLDDEERGIGGLMAKRLMSRFLDARSNGEVIPAEIREMYKGQFDLGAYEPLVDDVAKAIPYVLGVDPFERKRILN